MNLQEYGLRSGEVPSDVCERVKCGPRRRIAETCRASVTVRQRRRVRDPKVASQTEVEISLRRARGRVCRHLQRTSGSAGAQNVETPRSTAHDAFASKTIPNEKLPCTRILRGRNFRFRETDRPIEFADGYRLSFPLRTRSLRRSLKPLSGGANLVLRRLKNPPAPEPNLACQSRADS